MNGDLQKRHLYKVAIVAYGSVVLCFLFSFFVTNLEIEGWAERAALLGFKWTILPFIVIGALVIWGCRKSGFFVQTPLRFYTEIILSVFVLSAMSGLIATFINAYLGRSESIVLEGKVIRESNHDVRRATIEIVDDGGKRRELIVSDKQINDLKVGARYVRPVKKGSLGLLFVWRF